MLDTQVPYDPFTIPNVSQAAPTQYNPYLEDNSNLVAGANTAYYPTQASYAPTAQPVSEFQVRNWRDSKTLQLQYHLYAPIGPHREDLLAYQRFSHDFFMPEKLREELQRKSEASLQIMPSKPSLVFA